MSDRVIIYRDEKNGLILFSIDGKVVAKMTMSEWSKALASPRKFDADAYNFSREPA